MNLAMLFSWRVESLLHISNEFEYQPIANCFFPVFMVIYFSMDKGLVARLLTNNQK